jgi:hypothetical protein
MMFVMLYMDTSFTAMRSNNCYLGNTHFDGMISQKKTGFFWGGGHSVSEPVEKSAIPHPTKKSLNEAPYPDSDPETIAY